MLPAFASDARDSTAPAIFYRCCDKRTLSAGERGLPPGGRGIEELAVRGARRGQFIPSLGTNGGHKAAPLKPLRISFRCSQSSRGVERVR